MAQTAAIDEPAVKKLKLSTEIKDETRTSAVNKLKPLCENDVGMTEYLSTHKGFMAIIKQRYSDFLVNEIELDGKRVVLSDIESPSCEETETTDEQEIVDVLSSESRAELTKAHEDCKGEVWIKAGDDKAARGAIHDIVRKEFTHLESTTTEKDGVKYIKAFPSKSAHKKQKRGWPRGRPEYCKFIMYKENVDTLGAVNILAKYMRISANAFNYAGTKDKRAKTSQMLTCHKMSATRLYKLNRALRGMTLGNFSYCSAPLKLGDLQGNHFSIILRNVTGTDEQIHQGIDVIKKLGFINYFGMQRFGTTSVPTHHIGRAILHSKWEEAVELILQPREGDNEIMKKARETWRLKGDAKEALQVLGSKTGIERHLLAGITIRGKNDLVAAINHIPKNTRLMYLHSYQSFIWNLIVSERLKTSGTTLVLGDLVMPKQSDGMKGCPVVVTEANMGDFCIQDLVLPTPGYDVIYPTGPLFDKYKSLLSEDGFDLDSFRHKIKDYSLSGMYRAVLYKPTELDYEIIPYSDFTLPLLSSDLEILKGQPSIKAEEGGKMKALKLEFSLKSSTYATMLIREVLKCDTSAAFQSTLNVAATGDQPEVESIDSK